VELVVEAKEQIQVDKQLQVQLILVVVVEEQLLVLK
tara:strand:- start:11 stop:118 length:108 start_codon:yes stop_codon:yes gene_type:complete